MTTSLHLLLEAVSDPALTGAACVNHNPALFDSRGRYESNEHYQQRLHRAGIVCANCPVTKECRTASQRLKPRARTGIWAGVDTAPAPSKEPK